MAERDLVSMALARGLEGPMDVYVGAKPLGSSAPSLGDPGGQLMNIAANWMCLGTSQGSVYFNEKASELQLNLMQAKREEIDFRLIGLVPGMNYTRLPDAEVLTWGGGQAQFRPLVLVGRKRSSLGEHRHLIAYKTYLESWTHSTGLLYSLRFKCFAEMTRDKDDRVLRVAVMPPWLSN